MTRPANHLREVSRIGATVFALVATGLGAFVLGLLCAANWSRP